MEVIWGSEAKANLAEIARGDPKTARRIAERLQGFALSGVGDVRKLEGNVDEWRLRVGDWRAVFGNPAHLEVLRVANRRDAYR